MINLFELYILRKGVNAWLEFTETESSRPGRTLIGEIPKLGENGKVEDIEAAAKELAEYLAKENLDSIKRGSAFMINYDPSGAYKTDRRTADCIFYPRETRTKEIQTAEETREIPALNITHTFISTYREFLEKGLRR